MTKNTLLAATALTVIGFAGAANATDVVGTSAPFAGVTSVAGATNDPATLASERTFSATSATFVGDFDGYLRPSSGAFPNGQVLLTVSLAGGTFDEAVTSANIDAMDCAAAGTALSSGSAAGSSSVSFFISNLDTCAALDGTDNVQFVDLPVRNGGASTQMTVSITTVAGNLPVDGGPETVTIIDRAPGFTASVTAAGGTAPSVDLDDGYTTITPTTGTLGSVNVAANAGVFTDLNVPTSAALSQISAATYTLTGNTSGLEVTLNGATDTVVFPASGVVTTGATATTFAIADARDGVADTVEFEDLTADDDDIINGGRYTLTASYSLGTGFSPIVDAGDLNTIDREGTSVIVPWIGSASQSTNGVVSLVRVANVGTGLAGAVYAQAIGSTTLSGQSALVQLTDEIPAGGEFLVTQQMLEDNLGNFGRGDILLVVEADPTALTIQRRDTRNGVTSEISLGSALDDSNND